MTQAGADFFDRITSERSAEDKFQLFARHVEELGFTDLYYARRSFDYERAIVPNHFVKWDPNWAKVYVEGDFAAHDWVRQGIVEGAGLFRFDETMGEPTGKAREFAGLTESFGRQYGIGISFRNGASCVAGMSAIPVHGSRPSDEQVNRLHAAAYVFDVAMASEFAGHTAERIGLTKREVRLVNLLAKGQTAVQIAHVTGATEQWIRRSFMNIREKLWVGTNVELALRAKELLLID